MDILFGFLPFALFAIVERLAGAKAGLMAGAILSALLLLRNRMRGSKAKILEVGSAILFGALAIYAFATGTIWSVIGVRLRVDLGLLSIVLASIAIQRPFTIQYAREQVDSNLWNDPVFIRTNYVITSVWAAAFAVIVGADLLMLYFPTVPLKVGVIATILAIVGAVRFTSWYPDQLQPNVSTVSVPNR